MHIIHTQKNTQLQMYIKIEENPRTIYVDKE